MKYKPFDIIGLRAGIHAPTICIVPNEKLGTREKQRLKSEIFNWRDGNHERGYALGMIFGFDGSGLDSIVTIADYYKKIISSGNPGDILGDGSTDGQFSVIMDHKERALFDRARLMAAEQGLQFDGLKGFINYIRQIDFNLNPDGSYVSNFEERLGLEQKEATGDVPARIEAQMIVEAYGIIWSGPDAGEYNTDWASDNPLAVEQWYDDLEDSTTYHGPEADASTHWSHFAFEILYGHIASTSAQIHLMFSPEDWDAWMVPHYPDTVYQTGIFAYDSYTWFDPASWDPAHTGPDIVFPEMSGFGAGFLSQIHTITLLRFFESGRNYDYNDLKSLLQYLYGMGWLDQFNQAS